jgi:dihydroxy-acid dehydratase
MGTASTMACIAEALGMTLPGGASPPAVHADRLRIAEETGARRRAMIGPAHPTAIMTREGVENALRVLLASAARPTPSST